MTYDVIVLGSGPGGYVAAIRASQLGLKTAVVEKAELGGICLKDAKEYFSAIVKISRGVEEKMSGGVKLLINKNKIDVINGFGKVKAGKKVVVTDDKGKETEYTADKGVIIATGARSRELPNLKQDGKKVIGYREAMVLPKMPKKMVVVGSGAIGVEFAYFYNAMGCDVTVVEYMPNIVPVEDEEVSKQLERSFKKQGMKIMTNSSVEKVDTSGSGCKVTVKTKKGEEVIDCDIVLSAVGIQTNIEGIGLEEVGIVTDKGKIIVNDYYQTNIPGFYAIGDITPGPALAHVASAEGIICVEKIAGMHVEPLDYGNIPGCTYCSPEVASVGLTEKQAKDQGIDIKVGKFPFSASGKASAAGSNDGFVKLIFDAKYGELLGGHMIGGNVTEMIAEIVAVRKLETTGHELIKTVHPHPTLSEAVMEAAAAAYDEVIHL